MISETTFSKQNAFQLNTGDIELTAVYDFGPRLSSLRYKNCDNLFFWDDKKVFNRHKRWYLYGGHRLWHWRPGADESEETYLADNEACEVEKTENSFTLRSRPDELFKLQKSMEVSAIDEHTLKIRHCLHNKNDLIFSAGAWALTVTRPGKGTYYLSPLGDGHEWDSFNMVYFRKWVGQGQGIFEDPQFQIEGNMLKIVPMGKENKKMWTGRRGLLSMVDPERKILFNKYARYEAGGQYPENTNLAQFIANDNMASEMESMGPWQTLRPNEKLFYTEYWNIQDLGDVPSNETEYLRRQDWINIIGD